MCSIRRLRIERLERLIINIMKSEEITNQRSSGEQVSLPKQQSIHQELPSHPRSNPLLLRIHADDQDKKTICLFWTVLFAIAILLAIIANFAVPNIYIRNNLAKSESGSSLATCNNPSGLSGTQIVCQNNPLYFGEIIVGWSPVNQFGLLYLQVRPSSFNQTLTIQQNYSLQLNTINPRKDSNGYLNFYTVGNPSVINATINFSSKQAELLYSDDGATAIGFHYLMAVLMQFDDNAFQTRVKFSQNLNIGNSTIVRLQSYAINPQFTYYTIIIRYVFFAMSIGALVLYFIRFVRIPKEDKILEQKMVAVASVLLIMFNDPFYPLTILKPNPVSAFFSLLFIVNLISFLMLLWLVFADRIYFQEGQKESTQLTKKKVAYTGFVWLLLIVCLMIYTMQQVDGDPIIPDSFSSKFLAARIIIGIVVFCGVAYIAFRFVRSCMAPEGRTWRSELFMSFSSVFIFAVFIMLISNSLILFNYSGSVVLIVYGLINVYVYYLQYMYTITREEAQKLQNPQMQDNNYDVITVGTIDLVDIDLDDETKSPRIQHKEKVAMKEETQMHQSQLGAYEFD